MSVLVLLREAIVKGNVVWVLGGPPGSGKSHLVSKAAEAADAQPVRMTEADGALVVDMLVTHRPHKRSVVVCVAYHEWAVSNPLSTWLRDRQRVCQRHHTLVLLWNTEHSFHIPCDHRMDVPWPLTLSQKLNAARCWSDQESVVRNACTQAQNFHQLRVLCEQPTWRDRFERTVSQKLSHSEKNVAIQQ